MARFKWLDAAAVAGSVSSGLLILALGSALAGVLAGSFSWYLISASQGVASGPGRTFLAQLAGRYWAKVTPGNLGEFMRISYLRSPAQSSVGLLLSSHTSDLLVRNVALLVLGEVCLLYLVRHGLFSILHAVVAFALALAFMAWLAFLFLYRPFHRRLFGWAARLPLVKTSAPSLPDETQVYHEGLSRLRPGRLLIPFLFHLASMSLNYLAGHFIARSLGIALPLRLIYPCLAVAMMAVLLIPVSAFEIGSGAAVLTREFVLLRVPQGLIGAYVLLAALLSGVVIPCVGAAVWFSGLGRARSERSPR